MDPGSCPNMTCSSTILPCRLLSLHQPTMLCASTLGLASSAPPFYYNFASVDNFIAILCCYNLCDRFISVSTKSSALMSLEKYMYMYMYMYTGPTCTCTTISPPTKLSTLLTIGGLSSKFDEFLAGQSQFDSGHDHIWQTCADRSGNSSYLNKLAP